MGAYRQAYERSMHDPEGFWRDAAASVDWARAPDRILDSSAAPLYHWFPDAELNTCQSTTAPSRASSARIPIGICATRSRSSPARSGGWA